MKIGIIRYPGSNCDLDTLKYFDNSFFIWHNEKNLNILENMDLLVIPGGFAFGDRMYEEATGTYIISPGTMAIKSPVTNIILTAAKKSIPILGICNGFQILTQLELLPGKLLLNANKKFTCKKVNCDFKNKKINTIAQLYVANSYGRYSYNNVDALISNNQIFARYCDEVPEINSMHNIAGICNKSRNIFGMMPHPERNNDTFKNFLYQIIFHNNDKLYKMITFKQKVTELLHSEHISYKSTKNYLKCLPTEAEWVIQGPGENAGIVDIGNGYCIALRIESHNHPTFINPFEGAATGVGGILRDIFTMGARPIAILDFLRFGTDENSNRLLKETINGISYYGNCIGVPNVGGDLYRNPCYNKNPLVNIGCLGILKKKNIIYGNAKNCDDLLIYVGSKTGNEGINGAAMASKSFSNTTNIDDLQHNVQKGDPFLEKLLLEACCELAELGLAEGMQDMGAGGLLCASYEVIHRCREKTNINMGCSIEINKIPTKYKMDPCNILISESQERMLIVSTLKNANEIFKIFEKWDLEYAIVGHANQTGNYSIYNNGDLLFNEKMDNFKDIYEFWDASPEQINRALLSEQCHQNKKIKDINLWKVYDSTVGARTIKGPDKIGSYSILNIPEVNKQLFITWDEDFEICYKKMLELQAKPLCLVNCLNFGHPKDSMCYFSQNITKLEFYCKKFNVPIVGGNVSLYNSTDGVSIKPTPILMMLGISK